ncbi:MAG TPA: peroxidase family protein [Chthoniobacterales bacterium]|jgi:hypothetical protein
MEPFLESDPDKYCRLFEPSNRPANVEEWARVIVGLVSLTDEMQDDGSRPSTSDYAIDAGYTYFGQFVDHDLTKDSTSLSSGASLHSFAATALEPGEIVNNQTPQLDLGHLYGNGPFEDQKLYEPNDVRLRVGKPVQSTVEPGGLRSFDIALDANGRPLVGDSRAPENIILRQITAAFARLHNVAVEQWRSAAASQAELFERARLQTTWQFQWLVAKDYLATVLKPSVYRRVFVQGKPEASWKSFSIPVEFSVGAMRFGHSMVRDAYLISNQTAVDLDDLLRVGLEDRALDPRFEIDWGRFFQGAGRGGPATTAQPIDALISKGMYKIPLGTLQLFNSGTVPIDIPQLFNSKTMPSSLTSSTARLSVELRLPLISLLRGIAMRLPSGQAVADGFGVPKLTDAELMSDVGRRSTRRGAILQESGLLKATPLWYYVLKESEARENGNCLGLTGSHIVAETIHAALRYDPNSYMNHPAAKLMPPIWQLASGPQQLLSLAALFEAALEF